MPRGIGTFKKMNYLPILTMKRHPEELEDGRPVGPASHRATAAGSAWWLLPEDAWFSAGGHVTLWGQSAMPGDAFVCHTLGESATGT